MLKKSKCLFSYNCLAQTVVLALVSQDGITEVFLDLHWYILKGHPRQTGTCDISFKLVSIVSDYSLRL